MPRPPKLIYYCPYFDRKSGDSIFCEGGRVKHKEVGVILDYADKYCASKTGYENCSICKMLNETYERTYK